ncbi:DeoR/GlpR family DNA-binding transcription regulator [Corynebacterium felinum]|uniref:Lactose phosphotransferase system repressor n=1 Tax=Corynebacterium felinum TaxID=131318 RepID=A0ABU2BB72_9CORY|nr:MULTISPECIES: DeoR/GlpR family DNA-binding transcription regulator [Corynebacterium]MDF5821331.1 DeoR/GlpR family DNA-binding transcription regulator [Corynebacterium felinum]MDO4760725.1 DeoR/GlpR family DNA-binding transcription regulator [Corynebacterium sp.]MDR7355872.1 DeoR family fructose operon transcriptional repressor [Corynebacterium felinum]WJY95215.1 Glycerol-3-phosphate regulon repressor [Corynebacterium felinum]
MATVAHINGRHEEIVSLVNDHGRVAVADLAERFVVTAETIRRDLKALEAQGLLSRVHGGAVISLPSSPGDFMAIDEDDDQLPTHQSQRRKQLIAQAALGLMPGPGGSVFIDAGSTTEAFANVLAKNYVGQNWSVVTNSPNVARIVASAGVPHVCVVGGFLKARTQAVVGESTVEQLRLLRADVSFMGTNALDLEFGLSTSDSREAQVKSTMIGQSVRSVVLCDSTKLGRRVGVSFASVRDVDVVVTDRHAPEGFGQVLRSFETELVIP